MSKKLQVEIHARTDRFGLRTIVLACCGLLPTACVAPDDAPNISESSSAVTVGGAGGCSTSVVLGLAKQIAEEVDCTSPAGTLIKFDQTPRIRFASSAVMHYLSGAARNDLDAASNQGTLLVASGYRTVAQQYLLYRWYRNNHQCGIPKAASPGTSNHESARAVDLSNWSTRRSIMANHHWSEDVPGDPAHFEHLSSPDIRGRDVRAFQRLWNRNHPNDQIATDGIYGPTTADRLKRSPASGFAKGAMCVTHHGLEVVSIDGPDLVAPGATAHYAITVVNNDATDWPGDATLQVADGTASPMYDAATWTSPTDAGAIGTAVPGNGGQGLFDLDVVAPTVTERTPESSTFALTSGGLTLASFELSFTVTPDGDAGTSGDPGDDGAPDDGADADGVVPEQSGGCAAGGGGSWWLALLPLALATTRARARRRRVV